MIFNSDDFHVYRHMKKNASRMHVLSIRDLTPSETHTFLKGTHARAYPDAPPLTPADSMKVWDTIGGRMSYLGKVAKHEDVLKAAQDMVEQETEWLHHRLGLIPDHDDDVMDEQKVSSCSFVSSELGDLLLDTLTLDTTAPLPRVCPTGRRSR